MQGIKYGEWSQYHTEEGICKRVIIGVLLSMNRRLRRISVSDRGGVYMDKCWGFTFNA
jgi:hypothetical protein